MQALNKSLYKHKGQYTKGRIYEDWEVPSLQKLHDIAVSTRST